MEGKYMELRLYSELVCVSQSSHHTEVFCSLIHLTSMTLLAELPSKIYNPGSGKSIPLKVHVYSSFSTALRVVLRFLVNLEFYSFRVVMCMNIHVGLHLLKIIYFDYGYPSVCYIQVYTVPETPTILLG